MAALAKNLLKSALNRKMNNTRAAFEKVRTNTGQETYRPLEIYTKLKPQDFVKLAERYTLDQTLEYIKAMEGMRMKGK